MALNHLNSTAKHIIASLMWLILIGYAWHIRDDFSPLTEIPNTSLLWLCLLVIAQITLQTIQLPLLLSSLGHRLQWRTWLPLSIISSTLNMFLPAQGGTALRSIYLKKEHQISYSDSVALSAFQFIIRTLCAGVIVLITLCIYIYQQQPLLINSLLCGLVVLTIISGISIPIFIKLKKRASHPWLLALHNALALLHSNHQILLITISLNLLIIAFNAALFTVLLGLFGVTVSIEIILLYTSLKFLILIINILPGNMGVSEILTGFLTQLIHGGFDIGVAVAICARMLTIAIALCLSAISLLLRETRYKS